MKIGDEIIIKGKIVDFDSNPHGSAVKVELSAFIDKKTLQEMIRQQNQSFCPGDTKLKFWIHRLDQPDVIIKKK